MKAIALPIAAVGGICLALLAGCATTGRAADLSLLRDGYSSLGRGDNQAVVRHVDEFLAGGHSSPRSAEALYLRGLARSRMGDRSRAKQDWQEALLNEPAQSVEAHVRTALGDLAWQEGDLPTAEMRYRQSTNVIGNARAPARQTYWRLGRLLQRTGKWTDADICFSRLMHYFPNSDQARRAAARLGARAWSIQVGAFADKSNADAIVAVAIQAGSSASSRPAMRGGKMVQLVTIGRYERYDAACSALANIKRRYRDAFIRVTR